MTEPAGPAPANSCPQYQGETLPIEALPAIYKAATQCCPITNTLLQAHGLVNPARRIVALTGGWTWRAAIRLFKGQPEGRHGTLRGLGKWRSAGLQQ